LPPVLMSPVRIVPPLALASASPPLPRCRRSAVAAAESRAAVPPFAWLPSPPLASASAVPPSALRSRGCR
jgi:hypothetical protein